MRWAPLYLYRNKKKLGQSIFVTWAPLCICVETINKFLDYSQNFCEVGTIMYMYVKTIKIFGGTHRNFVRWAPETHALKHSRRALLLWWGWSFGWGQSPPALRRCSRQVSAGLPRTAMVCLDRWDRWRWRRGGRCWCGW